MKDKATEGGGNRKRNGKRMFCAKLGWRLLRRQWTDVINNAEADDPDASLVVFYLPLIALRQESFLTVVYMQSF